MPRPLRKGALRRSHLYFLARAAANSRTQLVSKPVPKALKEQFCRQVENLDKDTVGDRFSTIATAFVAQTYIHLGSVETYATTLSSTFYRAAVEHPTIRIDEDRLLGAPRVEGTRIPVYMILDALQSHGTVEGVKKSYPELTSKQIQDAIGFARFVVECPVEYQTPRPV